MEKVKECFYMSFIVNFYSDYTDKTITINVTYYLMVYFFPILADCSEYMTCFRMTFS